MGVDSWGGLIRATAGRAAAARCPVSSVLRDRQHPCASAPLLRHGSRVAITARAAGRKTRGPGGGITLVSLRLVRRGKSLDFQSAADVLGCATPQPLCKHGMVGVDETLEIDRGTSRCYALTKSY